MNGNSTFRYHDTAVLSITAVDAPVVMTSAEFDTRIGDSYRRNGLRPGMLENLAGITERRWWADGTSFVDGAIEAGAKAIAASGVDPQRIGLMINTSVCRDNLEPSVAVRIHHELGMPSHCLNFDLTNACLGFVNGMQLAATMIDAGQIDYALIVDGEDARRTHENTLDRLSSEDATAEDLLGEFASLTLGSGAAAMVLGRASEHPEGHRVVGGVSRAATENHGLCVGDYEKMSTDTRGLLVAGMQLAGELWEDARSEFDWADMDRYIVHQVSQVHTKQTVKSLGLDLDRVPLTFPYLGNVGPAAVAITLAKEAEELTSGDRVLMMGIGSGLNMTCLELAW
ncbi:3-oxoacyl-ACP synthase III [Ornithinicoccus hortensis]|uniref:3-oxoacyl-[acyl-carrier-protein] synthase-3 n=1 Tax=Ornithinicoccus hortensis TaxID=82346 RepID=A0A542YVG1_9MICO|nr:3-oxoacyl-ACP synthase III [Ornithinicoccus hortensis]TQL52067.1 3-oxoacyl-[acyl-carrier-protein] synthase-3 [Ornithinicoccus hortensis]